MLPKCWHSHLAAKLLQVVESVVNSNMCGWVGGWVWCLLVCAHVCPTLLCVCVC